MHLWIASIAVAVHLTSVAAVDRDSALVIAKSDTLARAAAGDTTGAGHTIRSDSARAAVLATQPEAAVATVLTSTWPMDARLRAMPAVGNTDSFASGPDSSASDTTRTTRRPRAIEYSDAYHTRLKIHQIGAYLMIPLFIGEYVLGEKLLTSTNRSNGLKTAHSVVAAGVGVVFVANTVTGAWNFWDARKDPNGRTRRDIHSALMLASDAGFLWTAASAGGAQRSLTQARKHRAIAISSIAISAIGAGMMWLWKN
jgi:hypothetical protein